MKKPKLYSKTVNILVRAYFNDTLEHSQCNACAVGNLCGGRTDWASVFTTAFGIQTFWMHNYTGKTKAMIDNTGYSVKELARIEFAFESVPECENEDERMFNGLMAVIDVLDEIHDNKDAAITTGSKKRFNKVTSAQVSDTTPA